MRKPIADPFMIFPDRRPTLHEHCMRHQNCTGQGCRARGHRWPSSKQRHFQKIAKSNHEGPNSLPLPIPHRIVDLLPAKQVIALWGFRQNLLDELYLHHGEANA